MVNLLICYEFSVTILQEVNCDDVPGQKVTPVTNN
jgi:hypothetical protein